MSSKIMGGVWDLDLPHAERLVLLAMADHADHQGNQVYPSVALIAWKTGYSDRQVQRIIKQLRDSGILVLVRAPAGKPSTYRINLAAGKLKPSFREHDQRQNVTPEDTQNVTPDKMSPVTQLRRGSGDIAMSSSGDIAMSPKPSLTIIEPSDDDDAHGAVKTVVGALIDLDLLRGQAIALVKRNPTLDLAAVDQWRDWLAKSKSGNPLGLMIAHLKEGRTHPPSNGNRPQKNIPPPQPELWLKQRPDGSHYLALADGTEYQAQA